MEPEIGASPEHPRQISGERRGVTSWHLTVTQCAGVATARGGQVDSRAGWFDPEACRMRCGDRFSDRRRPLGGNSKSFMPAPIGRSIRPLRNLVQKQADALLVGPDPLFNSRLMQLATLAVHHRVPAIYFDRAFAEGGGLLSYGANVTDQHRQLGVYIGRILKGEKPADMPVLRATKFEFVINLHAAKLLGITVPPTLLGRADEVIE